MRNPRIKSRHQHIRLWFEFYKLCLNDPSLKDNLKTSKDYYKPWGDISNVLFDEWWKTHKKLFGEVRVREIDRVSKYENVVNVSIPLNLPVSQSIKDLKELIETKQQQRLNELGISDSKQKTKTPSFGQYELTKGVERHRRDYVLRPETQTDHVSRPETQTGLRFET